MRVDLEDILVWDEKTRTLWSIEDLNPVYNGRAIQLNIPRKSRFPTGKSRSTTKGEVRKTARRAFEPKTKRAPSAYNKRYSAEYKRQKKKHPRSSFAQLSKKTHKALRRKK